MSLSPLYADWINDLHVNTTAVLHQPFDWLRHIHVKITTFRVYARRLCEGASTCGHTQTSLVLSCFRCAVGLFTQRLAAKRNSLIRVTRRAESASLRVGSLRALALMYKGFTSFKQPLGAFFSPFARATRFAIGQRSVLSLGRSIPPVFTLHSQAVLIFQHACVGYRCFTVYTCLLRGNLPTHLARPQLVSHSGLACMCSFATTYIVSF